MTQPAIHYDQMQTGGAISCRAHARRRVRHPSTFDRKPLTAAHMATSLPCRQLGEGNSPRRFPRLGWTGSLNEIADVRRLILSGIDERLAAQVVADQFGHQPAIQAFADVPEFHLPSLPKSSNDDALEATDGAQGSVPVRTGKLPPERGELPHVGRC